MNSLFILTIIFVFLTILIESISLILQLNGRKLSKWFGKDAFNIHMNITAVFWLITICLIVVLQFSEHPMFHSIIPRYIGFILFICGIILAIWAFTLLGLKRALCLNFFEDNVPIMKKSLYKYINNPLDYGFWTALIGFAVFTRSIYNLIIALEFIIMMLPHMILENIPLKK